MLGKKVQYKKAKLPSKKKLNLKKQKRLRKQY